MITSKPLQQPNNLVDEAAQAVDHGIRATQDFANETLDSMADTVQDARKQATPFLNHATEKASALAQRGLDAVHDRTRQLRERVVHASDSTIGYVKEEPVKTILIAAAVGAALMALVSLINRSRDPV